MPHCRHSFLMPSEHWPDVRARSLPLHLIGFVTLLFALAGCGTVAGSGGSSSQNPPPPTISVAVSPKTAPLVEGASQQFSANVTGTSNTAVTWTATGGTISTAGLYVAGSAAGNFTVTATSAADTTKSGQGSVTISAPAPPPGTASSITKDGITWTFSEAIRLASL
jgi:hypothetical protein